MFVENMSVSSAHASPSQESGYVLSPACTSPPSSSSLPPSSSSLPPASSSQPPASSSQPLLASCSLSAAHLSLLPACVSLESLSEEDRRLVAQFRVSLEALTGSMESIVAASDALLFRGNYPVVHCLLGAWMDAFKAQSDSEKLLFLLYVLNDALQKSASRRCLCLLQLALAPLRAFCVEVAQRHAGILDASSRVFKILKVRRVFGNNENGDAICAAFLALLQGAPSVSLPPVSPETLKLSPLESRTSASSPPTSGLPAFASPHAPSAAAGGASAFAPPGVATASSAPCLPAAIDSFSLQFPSKNDAAVAAYVDALFPEEMGETRFRGAVKEALEAIRAVQSAIADKGLARLKQEQQLAQLTREKKLLEEQQRQKRVKFSKCGVLPEDEATAVLDLERENEEAAQKRLLAHSAATRAKLRVLLELEWNQRIDLQERLASLAETVESRMEAVLARHVRCREVKTILDRALHTTLRQQASKGVGGQPSNAPSSTSPSSSSASSPSSLSSAVLPRGPSENSEPPASSVSSSGEGSAEQEIAS
ncbi:hypothetical protein TGVEG_272760 [Toxoplasma gondii VEG]|uniref:CID domain-containing protein n=2 Tax=Toxoplasma gondii (strain ATCC 50861 / VEG) TaxID=432359 RepID=V4Z704_TOXGV|nr:hypothetical protein TGVEG_272760 [Toxoplasma gondii VEG]